MIDPPALVERLRARRSGPLPEPRAAALAAQILSFSPAVGLTREDDLVDLLDLWLSLAEAGPAPALAQGLFRVVLSQRAWPVAARLSFLRRHLLGRAYGPDDDRTARALFGLPEVAS